MTPLATQLLAGVAGGAVVLLGLFLGDRMKSIFG